MAELPEDYDAVVDVRTMRDEDNRLVEAKYARIAATPEDPDAGRNLLGALGLGPAETVGAPQHQPMPVRGRSSVPPPDDWDF
jgi:hypothetical protein